MQEYPKRNQSINHEVLLAPKVNYSKDQIIELINSAVPTDLIKASLSGRGPIYKGQIAGHDGTYIVKRYLRGGLFQHLLGENYFRIGTPRPFHEMSILLRVRACDILAPEPIAAAILGNYIYRGWLITKEIQGAISLVELVSKDEDVAQSALVNATKQIFKLIDLGIFHVDLHPGNVLIDLNSDVWLIDFDKAVDYVGSKSSLRDLYILRWRRAVNKHNLPDWLVELFCHNLRIYF